MRKSVSAPSCVKTQKILLLQKSASQNARYAVFSVLGIAILPTNILRFGVFTQPGPEADVRNDGHELLVSARKSHGDD